MTMKNRVPKVTPQPPWRSKSPIPSRPKPAGVVLRLPDEDKKKAPQ
jgi:hypothetical protein